MCGAEDRGKRRMDERRLNATRSQIHRPIDDIKEQEGEREERAGIKINAFGCRGYDRFRGRRLLVLDLRFARSVAGINGFAVAVEV